MGLYGRDRPGTKIETIIVTLNVKVNPEEDTFAAICCNGANESLKIYTQHVPLRQNKVFFFESKVLFVFSVSVLFGLRKKVNDADVQEDGEGHSKGIPAGREGSSSPHPLPNSCGSGSSALGFNKRSGHYFPASTTRART